MEIRITIPPELLKQLSPEAVTEYINALVYSVGNDVEGANKQAYPTNAPNSPVVWASDAQRKRYFAMRRELGLDAPYVRNSDPMSERINLSWSTELTGRGHAKVANSATYAPYVIGQQQQKQHELTGWRKITDVVSEYVNTGKIQRIAEELARKILGAK